MVRRPPGARDPGFGAGIPEAQEGIRLEKELAYGFVRARVELLLQVVDVLRGVRRVGVAFGVAADADGKATQISQRRFMSAAEVDSALRDLMKQIHDRVAQEGRGQKTIDYARGANVAAYRKLAQAMTSQGLI